jgi:hypothetical protein
MVPVILAACVIAAMCGGFALAGKVVEKTWAQLLLGVVIGAGLIAASVVVLSGIAFAGCVFAMSRK